jgi:DNA-binding MarR family transcriptional regulator
MEPSLQSCLESVGISHLGEWDVFAFVYRHGSSLVTAEHIARLTGHELAVVGKALDRLEGEKIIEQSRSSQGVRFYRIVALMDVGRQRALQQLIALSETRAGRVLMEEQLRPVIGNRGEKKLRLESEGKWLCLKAI